MSILLRKLARTAVALVLCWVSEVQAGSLIDTLVQRFAQSDFEFVRVKSNAPLLPLAWVDAAAYEEGAFAIPNSDASPRFRQSSVSQGAFVPVPIGRRDAVVVGEWLSWTRFDLQGSDRDLEVFSVAVPLGWARQLRPNWQLGAFVAPLGHRTPGDAWYWETLGGVFGRYTHDDRVAWLFGAYFDVSPLEDFYTPYVGATFLLNEQWSINAVMPWPSVTYAPSRDLVFRLGVAPSGTSWSIERGGSRPRMSFSAWNFGLGIERRVYEHLWLGIEAGVSGIRGLSVVGGDWQGVETKFDHTGFVLLTLNFRPSVDFASKP
jgi:hypothetical protein